MNRVFTTSLSTAALLLASHFADASGSYNPQLRRRQPKTASEPERAANTLVNVDAAGVALQGYDPVAFFSQGQPVKGAPELTASFQGATYYFADTINRDRFRAHPEKYAPQFGGFSSFGVARGVLIKINPAAFQIIDGRLYLQQSFPARKMFDRESAQYIQHAEANWPELVATKGQEVSR